MRSRPRYGLRPLHIIRIRWAPNNSKPLHFRAGPNALAFVGPLVGLYIYCDKFKEAEKLHHRY